MKITQVPPHFFPIELNPGHIFSYIQGYSYVHCSHQSIASHGSNFSGFSHAQWESFRGGLVMFHTENLTGFPKVLQLLCLPGGVFTSYPSLYMLNSFFYLSVFIYSPSLESDSASLWNLGYKNNRSGSN